MELIETVATSSEDVGSAQKKIKTLYDNITNMEARNQAGYAPIADALAAIENVQSVSELVDLSILDGAYTALEAFNAAGAIEGDGVLLSSDIMPFSFVGFTVRNTKN